MCCFICFMCDLPTYTILCCFSHHDLNLYTRCNISLLDKLHYLILVYIWLALQKKNEEKEQASLLHLYLYPLILSTIEGRLRLSCRGHTFYWYLQWEISYIFYHSTPYWQCNICALANECFKCLIHQNASSSSSYTKI